MSKKYNILVPDDLHLNQRNFPSFHKFITKTGSSVKFIKDRKDWVALYGNYESKVSELNEKARVLACLPADTLFNYNVRGVNLFKISRAETLSKVAVEPEWYDVAYPESSRGIFDKLLINNKPVLMLCLAAAWDWLDFWSKTLADEKLFTHCCVFSGSLIYQRSLIELLRYTPTKVMVMESLFTGNDYYCEEKYGPIANNCEIRHKAVYESLAVELSANDMDKERVKAINKVILAKNKNVEQPDFGEEITFPYSGKIVTILGQVVNDFSLLEYRNTGLASISFYKDLIGELVKSGFNVVFKSHPWEEKKTNIKTSLTRDILLKYISDLPEVEKCRIKIVDHYPIEKLFANSDFVAGLNSQSLIEAAFNGLKPLQFGNAFFGGKGFTGDYPLTGCKDCVDDILAGNINGTLNFSEYKNFETFLCRLMQGQLVSVHDSGVSKIESIFLSPATIGVAKKSSPKNDVPPKVEDVPKKVNGPSALVVANKVQIKSSPAKEENSRKDNISAKNRKFKKFIANPRKFFADSKSPLARSIRHLF
ncbi:MAG: capsule biosynthesis protein [Comamonas sp.]|uniref:capsular polysaccharide export protein, LipB/KpsS family n=1 Tax=Comamonas sp. TaxID=34028 RepID=UPI0012CEDB47|nr:hypothetical protein [Comamonas sp.]MPS87686.1 capsule biosynthesis protein [Comamonas sp.]